MLNLTDTEKCNFIDFRGIGTAEFNQNIVLTAKVRTNIKSDNDSKTCHVINYNTGNLQIGKIKPHFK